MKSITGIILAVWITGGCVAGSTLPHADSPGAEKRDEGPALCRDGTAPPCNDRN